MQRRKRSEFLQLGEHAIVNLHRVSEIQTAMDDTVLDASLEALRSKFAHNKPAKATAKFAHRPGSGAARSNFVGGIKRLPVRITTR